MINDILQGGINAVKEFIGGEPEPTIRERINAPGEAIRQPVPEQEEIRYENDFDDIPDIPEMPENYDPPAYGREDDSFDLGQPDDYDFRTEQDIQDTLWNNGKLEQQGIEAIDGDATALESSPIQAKSQHLEDIKTMENREEKGLVKSHTGDKFFPTDSMEGQGPDSGMSTMEIGYGVKVPKTWLTGDKRSWPIIDGVKVDVSKGITKQQAESLSRDLMEKAYKAASPKLSSWSKMTEKEKTFWADLTYNGGASAINKNPKARAAANAGHTVEGMILALDFIKAGGKVARGLLNRRISMYNQAALEVTGAPIIEKYEFGDEIKVKFSSSMMTDKVSKRFTKKINDAGGWYTVTKGSGKQETWEVGDNFKFEA